MGPCSVSYGLPKALKKKKPLATEEKRITTPQKKMTVTWRPAGMAPMRSGKTTGKKTKQDFNVSDYKAAEVRGQHGGITSTPSHLLPPTGDRCNRSLPSVLPGAFWSSMVCTCTVQVTWSGASSHINVGSPSAHSH